jgi:PAS domain S-box-containing protein
MTPSSESIRVLHVDDEPDFADVAAAFVERRDGRFDVETAASATEGFDHLASDDFDCVVSDYDMPGRNGIEFLEDVRAEYPDLPFILFTGKGSEEVASDAISAGVTDYLQKGGGTEQYELLANRVLNAVEQYRSKQRAAELDRIRTLASDINQALVRAESRADAETRVCEIISDSDPYLFAWIGEVDPETDRIVPRMSAGVEAGYLDDITVTADESPTGRGPAGTAIRERRVAVSQNVAEDPEFELWRDEALDRGYRAAAAVPLEYETSLYGELVVYADRANAFDENERELLGELGDDVAHALHSFDVRDQLRRERDRRRGLFENAPGPVIAGEIHEDGVEHRITDVNDAFEDVFGYEAAEVVGEDVADIVVPEEGMKTHEELRERAAAGETLVAEVERTTTGGLRTFLLTVIPYGIEGDHAAGWYAWFTDVSERRAYEQTIEGLYETSDELMSATTAKAVAERTIEAVRDILGLPANGVHLYDENEDGLVPVAWTAKTEEIVGDPPTFAPGEGLGGIAYQTGETQIYDDISRVSERFNPDTEVRSQIVVPLDHHGVLLIGSPEPDAFDDVDISLAETLASHATAALERVEREERFRRRQSLFEAILETSIDGILVVDENREYVTWNQQFIEMWEIPKELIENNPEEMGLEAVLGKLEDPQEFIEKVEYLYEHPHEAGRDEIRLDDGRVFDRYSAPVEADEGTYFGRVWFFRDVTDSKEREKKLARQNARLEEFASVVSHDLRNPLNVAQGRLELAREHCDSEHLDSASQAIGRSFTLIEDLLALAREGENASIIEAVDLAKICDGCWQNVETGEATFVNEVDRMIRADLSRLKQLLENLMGNAVEHGGERVTVTVGDLDDGFYIADDGPGIPEDEREDVFEAGYSTTDEGTGFGLNIVNEIVEAHGWEIGVSSSEYGGARFEITGVELANG